jgi:hypothetical protein
MEMIQKINLADAVKSLYIEFTNYLNSSGKSGQIIAVYDGKLSIDFQIPIMNDKFNENLKILSNLPSFNTVIKKTSEIQGITEDKVLESQ